MSTNPLIEKRVEELQPVLDMWFPLKEPIYAEENKRTQKRLKDFIRESCRLVAEETKKEIIRQVIVSLDVEAWSQYEKINALEALNKLIQEK